MYYEVEIQTNPDGTESKDIYSYETIDEAKKVFHQKMASGITQGLGGSIDKTLNLVINDIGNTEIMEIWEKHPEPESESKSESEPEEET